MTRQFLVNAFSGESMAHMRYLIFAEIAEKEGFTNVARLFRAIAHAELVHARNHYNNLKEYSEAFGATAGTPAGPGNTSKNLELAAMGEEYEVNEMHPVYPILLGYRAKKVLRGVSTTLSRLRKYTRSYTERQSSTWIKARTGRSPGRSGSAQCAGIRT